MTAYVKLSAWLLQFFICLEFGARQQFVCGQMVSCGDSQFYDSSTSACSSCPTGCSACTSSTSCSGCRTGYFASNSSCLKCSAGCASCTSLDSCTTCQESYYLDWGNNISKISNLSNDTNATNSTNGTNTSNSTNTSNGSNTANISNGSNITNASNNSNRTCQPCPSNCLRCSAKNTCELCMERFVWDIVSSSCVSLQSRSAGRQSALSTAAIVGISVGSAACLALGGFGIYCLIKGKAARPAPGQPKITITEFPAASSHQSAPPAESNNPPVPRPATPDHILDQAQVHVRPNNTAFTSPLAQEANEFDQELPKVMEENHLNSVKQPPVTIESTPLVVEIPEHKGNL